MTAQKKWRFSMACFFILSLILSLSGYQNAAAQAADAPDQTEMNIPADAVYWAGHYYKAFDEMLTPSAAAEKCKAMGGYLATITTRTEYDQVWSLISAKSKGKSAYQLMGIHSGSDGWYWDNGEEFCYTNWAEFYSAYGGNGYHTLRAGCLGWSDSAIAEHPQYSHASNGFGGYFYVEAGSTASSHNMALCNGTLTYTRYAFWGGRTSVSAVGGMVEYNDTDKANGYVCEWGAPVQLKSENIFLNGQTSSNESTVLYPYNGSVRQPRSVDVYYENVKLTLNSDYISEIKPRAQVGTAQVNITGINRYQGLAVKYYYVVPEAPGVPEIEMGANRKERVVKWNSPQYALGYLLEYSTSPDFKYDVHRIKIAETAEDGNNEYTLTGLEGGITYYARIASLGDLNDDNCASGWSGKKQFSWESGLWMTIFSNQNQITDGGHAFLNVENCTEEDVYIGPYRLAAGDNAYIGGRGIKDDSMLELKNSSGGVFINYESVNDKEQEDGVYKDFAWYTIGIKEKDLDTLFNSIKAYGNYSVTSNNCCHFATTAWNAIADEKHKVCSTGMPAILKNHIVNKLGGKIATQLRMDNKNITDILIMDSKGDLVPFVLTNGEYQTAVNSLYVSSYDENRVTLKWDSPRKLIGKDQYNITQVLLECVNETDQSTRIIRLPADSTQTTVRQLTPGAAYAFRLYAESDHTSTKTGIVTGLKSFALRIRTLMKSDASLPASITSIADEAFMNTSFSAAAIPDGTERIGKKAFSGNTHLRQVCIPASVTEISDDAFDGCSDDLILYGVPGSYAESWATLNGYTFCPHE